MSTRLPAAERKAAVLDCACGIFSSGSYRGTTTAEIAREAGVTEPVLYRHFASKRAALSRGPGRVVAAVARALGRRGRRGARSPLLGRRDGPRVLRGEGSEGDVCRSLDAGADRGERRCGDPEVPPQADAGGARLRERCDPPLPGSRRRPPGPQTRAPKPGSSSRSACLARSAAAWAACSTRTSRQSSPRAFAG